MAATAAASFVPGGSTVVGALSNLSSFVSVVDPGKARDAARIKRRDFFLNAAKAGSVIGARYLLGGEAPAYTIKEKSEYRDGVAELTTKAPEVLSTARALGPLWDDDAGSGNLEAIANRIAVELGQKLNAPAGTADVAKQGDIEAWARQFGYKIRKDASESIATLAAGVGSAAASSVAPSGSSNRNSVLVPTNRTTLVVIALLLIGIVYVVVRKR